MDNSIVLAEVWGVGCVIFGLSMLFNKKWMAEVVEELTKNQGLLWLAGFLALVLGMALVALNNVWTSGLTLLVTILGWLTLLKGAAILLFPNFTVSWYRKMNKGNLFAWCGVIVFLLGLVLLYVAFT